MLIVSLTLFYVIEYPSYDNTMREKNKNKNKTETNMAASVLNSRGVAD